MTPGNRQALKAAVVPNPAGVILKDERKESGIFAAGKDLRPSSEGFFLLE